MKIINGEIAIIWIVVIVGIIYSNFICKPEHTRYQNHALVAGVLGNLF